MNISIIRSFLEEASKIMLNNKERLIEEDNIIGDGDLGLTMSDGFIAAYESVKSKPQNDCGKTLYFAGKAVGNKVPSTMGTLMASGLMEAGKQLKGKTELYRSDITTIFSAYLEGVQKRGGARIGDKTFVDGLHPAIEALKKTENLPLKESAKQAADAAMKGYKNTEGMLAVHGRAAIRGEKSRKLLDPGALVAALLMEAFYHSVE